MPKFLSILVSVLAAGLFCLCGPASAQNAVRIGFGGALQGNLATYGRSNLFGIE